MQRPGALARRAARALLRRLVPFVSSRPWMVGLAARVFAMAPSLKRRLRMALTGAPQAIPSEHLRAEQAAVLSDLRQAVRLSQGRDRG
jgi:hypothetical protein